jgi:hypothetical protein
MSSAQENILHLVFCATHFGVASGLLLPIWYVFPGVALLYLFARYWPAALGVPIALGWAAVELVLLAGFFAQGLYIAVFYDTAAILVSPGFALATWLAALALVLMPTVVSHVLSSLLKIWITFGLMVLVSGFAYLVTLHPAFGLLLIVEIILFLCAMFFCFVAAAMESLTCALVRVADVVRPAFPCMFAGILLLWILLIYGQ